MKNKKIRQLLVIAVCLLMTIFGFIMQVKSIQNSSSFKTFFFQEEKTNDQ